ncbi:hypothetical protein FDG2_1097 [Candidatus Protofrankia californiensis]|uniref:Uncharacterized protein n=1 Tax=Candidatus Protofrankia californiensis TaxID=1839754 RepID=A0A1C3NV29_9ACTN|nr:hypothetical protein FDG2_1097 [Candidatus Protofrankia californiensis]
MDGDAPRCLADADDATTGKVTGHVTGCSGGKRGHRWTAGNRGRDCGRSAGHSQADHDLYCAFSTAFAALGLYCTRAGCSSSSSGMKMSSIAMLTSVTSRPVIPSTELTTLPRIVWARSTIDTP